MEYAVVSPRPLPCGLVVKYGSKYLFYNLLRDTMSLVRDRHLDILAHCQRQRIIFFNCYVFRFNLYGSAFRHRLYCVEKKIIEDLCYLALVSLHMTQIIPERVYRTAKMSRSEQTPLNFSTVSGSKRSV